MLKISTWYVPIHFNLWGKIINFQLHTPKWIAIHLQEKQAAPWCSRKLTLLSQPQKGGREYPWHLLLRKGSHLWPYLRPGGMHLSWLAWESRTVQFSYRNYLISRIASRKFKSKTIASCKNQQNHSACTEIKSILFTSNRVIKDDFEKVI